MIEKKYIISGTASLVVVILDRFLFWGGPAFYFVIGLAVAIALLPYILSVATENKREQEVAEMFLEFSRNLAESVNTGTPISKSIINMKKKNYGPLSIHIEKLANQIALGIPVNKALHNFSRDVNSPVISRAVALISEAERAGGQIDYILESVAKSISEVEKLKNERKAAISNLVVQGYIIFFIFIGIMLVMEYKILPLTSNIGSFGGLGGSFGSNTQAAPAEAFDAATLARPFLYLLLTQGFFAGLTIGKLTEGKIMAGIKHSFILSITAFLVSTGTHAILG
ncbi:MAG TPA: type II secretion system F family protein [Candidatus Nanoarchaeia archaeon]|nr:type II secretion system F family protein [Candidatus Nanoarchaeia archaeon]